MFSDSGRSIVDQKRVSAHARGWVIFNVTRAVREWAYALKENHGKIKLSVKNTMFIFDFKHKIKY